jgi:hypothetical protein
VIDLAGDVDETLPAVPLTDADVRAAFDAPGAPPRIAPTPDDRLVAEQRWPPAVVDGPGGRVPDPNYSLTPTVEIVVPPWVLAYVAHNVRQRLVRDPESADSPRTLAGEALLSTVQTYDEFRTPDGRDAFGAVLEALDVDALRTDE